MGQWSITAKPRGAERQGLMVYMISWSAPPGAAAVEVRVTEANGRAALFARGSAGHQLAAFIAPRRTYIFGLYQSSVARSPTVSTVVYGANR